MKVSSSLEDLFSSSPTPAPEKKSGGDAEEKKKEENKILKEDFKVDVFDSLEDIGKKNSGGEIRNVIATSGLHCSSPFNSVKIEKKAMEDIFLMAQAVNEIASEQFEDDLQFEVYCYLLGDKPSSDADEPLTINEIYIPPHTAEEARVSVEIDAVRELSIYLAETGKIVLGWAHSHGQFDAYSSETDDANHRALLNETSNFVNFKGVRMKYIYEITVNARNESYGVVLTQFPCTYIAQSNDTEIEVVGEDYTSDEKEARLEEIRSEIRLNVRLMPPTEQFSLEESKMQIKDSILSEFIASMLASKRILKDQIYENDKQYAVISHAISEYDKLVVAALEDTVLKQSEQLFAILKNVRKNV